MAQAGSESISGGIMSKTLLLADDSVTIQKVVGISFASEDVAVIAVDNGDDAIARAREERPDAILADVVMPGKNGYEVCEAIKADPALAHIPVVLLTGTFEAFDADRAESAGAAGHIAKPFESQTLVDMVMKLFSSTPAPAVAAGTNPRAARSRIAMDIPPVAQASTPDAPSGPEADAFDFFDDDLEAADVVAEPERLDGHPSHGFGSESAFTFSEADLAPTAETPLAATQPALAAADSMRVAGSTAEMPISAMADEIEPFAVVGGHEFDDDLGQDLSLDSQLDIDADLGRPMSVAGEFDASITFDDAPQPGDSLAPLDNAGNSTDDPFDFAFESGNPDPLAASDAELTRVDGIDLMQDSTLYPGAGPNFDVASSDFDPAGLGGSEMTVQLGLEPSGHNIDTGSEPEPAGDGVVVSPDHTFGDYYSATELATTEPVDLVSSEVVASFEGPQTAHEPTSEPVFEPAADAASDFEAHPLPDALPSSSFGALTAAETSVFDASDSKTAARAQAVLEQIEPELRLQLHDTLEKIAWEAFADLTDSIVRLSVAKVEKIAWEVVPQLIETLVREEIRKMKGEPPSDD